MGGSGPNHHDHTHEHDHTHSHDHAHGHDHGLRGTPLARLTWAFALTASFMVAEAVVGWLSGSLALVADAGHMLADAAALALAMFAQRVAAQARTRAKTYGFRRAEVLAAFANGVALALTAAWIFIEAAHRLRAPRAIDALGPLMVAALGLAVNLGAAWILHGGAARHNVNTRAAMTHVLSDALGSVGAIASSALVLGFGWTRADSFVSVLIGLLILWSGWRLVRETLAVLMEGIPAGVDLSAIEATLRGAEGVTDFHDLHVWSISEGFDVMTVHVVVEPGHHGIEVVTRLARLLNEKHGLDHVTIQPERPVAPALVPLRRGPRPPG